MVPLCPEQLRIAWDLVVQRIIPVVPDEASSKSLTGESIPNALLWRNYCVFSCATAYQPERIHSLYIALM